MGTSWHRGPGIDTPEPSEAGRSLQCRGGGRCIVEQRLLLLGQGVRGLLVTLLFVHLA
jgi:hypothetical protein